MRLVVSTSSVNYDRPSPIAHNRLITTKDIYLFLLLNCCVLSLTAQEKLVKIRPLQFSIAPSVGTNGLQPGSFTNQFSFNLTSGYSAKNLAFEIAGISNLNTNGTSGLQIAGLANVTGGNAFAGLSKKEANQKLKSGFNSHLSGIQVSGLTNIVVDEVFGLQLTGGINLGKNSMFGTQVAGISNIIYKFSFGLQVAGISNVSVTSMDGVQIAALINRTEGGLYGFQLGAFNHAGSTEGINSFESKNPWGVQLGLFNFAERMNGFQVGLINWAKRSQGTQIGLINIYRQGGQVNSRDGTAFGLLNIGQLGYLSVYSTELFALNYEFATGNAKNKRINLANKNTYWVNSVTYSRSPFSKGAWSMGYGVKKMFFNRSTVPGMMEFRFLSCGMDFQHVSFDSDNLTKSLSLLSRAKVEIGTRLKPKLYGIYIFGGLTYNCFWTDTDRTLAPSLLKWQIENNNQTFEFWPGFVFGVMIHG